DEVHGLLDGHPRELNDALAGGLADVADADGAAFRPQALALARAARLVAEVAQVVLAHALGGGLLEAAHEHRDDAFEAGLVGAGAPAMAPPDAHGLIAGSVAQEILDLARQVLPRLVERHPEPAGAALDLSERPAD